MDYLKEYKSFINSHYLSDGVRITAGIVLPAIILNYFGLLIVGVVVSLGALCVSVTDTPGPIQHRRNGMLICTLLIFLVSLVTGFASSHAILLGFIIVIFCFIFSMIAVYGSRAISVGVAALLVMVLNIGRPYEGRELIIHSFYILLGGLWYTAMSLVLYSFRPYKLLKQALGECIMATADYLRIRAAFYDKEVNYEKVYRQMMDQQVTVHKEQQLVRELLFKTRSIVKESTLTGRTLVLIFIDTVDLFERTMTSYHDYEALHRYFDNSGMLTQFHQFILKIAEETDDIGIAVKSGNPSKPGNLLEQQLKETKKQLDDFRDLHRTAENLEGFISLRNILNSLEDISGRIRTLHLYTTYDKKIIGESPEQLDVEKFVSSQDTSPKLLRDNLTLKSNIFRHSLRISIATLIGYLVSFSLPVGHNYWILLTIIVILKPAYSLTKKRNYERLLGTIGGAFIGILVLYIVKNHTLLLAIMLLFMIGTYSFIRTNYMLAVILMTPYILLLFHLLYKTNFEAIILDRVLDTGIGSVIALLSNSFILPAWEHEKIGDYMADVLEKNAAYFHSIAMAFIDKPAGRTQYKLSRKNAFVALANLSDAFSRMLSEPRNRQKNSKLVHQFVVLNHMLTSYTATLSSYAASLSAKYRSDDFRPVTHAILKNLENAKSILLQGNNSPVINEERARLSPELREKVNVLFEQRQEEIRHGVTETDTRKKLAELKSVTDQFGFIATISSDIKKISRQIADGHD